MAIPVVETVGGEWESGELVDQWASPSVATRTSSNPEPRF